MASLGELVVSLAANTAAFTADLGKAAHEAAKTAESMAKGFAVVGLAIDGVKKSAQVLSRILQVDLMRAAINSADAMSKMAQSTGIGISTLSELSYAANLAGVASEALGTSIGRLNRNIVDASTGSGESVRAFEALGISVKNVDGSLKAADVVMGEVADKFATFDDGPEKSALAMMLFGKAGTAMIPMLNEGSDAIEKLRDEARALGLTLDSETGVAAEKFNDNLQKLGLVTTGLANSIMRDLLPEMNAFTDSLVEAAKAGKQFESFGKAAKVVFQTLAVLGSDLSFIFRMIGGEIEVWGKQLQAITKLDWKGFKLIGENWTKEAAQARKDLDEFQKRIMGFYDVVGAGAAGGAMDMGEGLRGLFKERRPPPKIAGKGDAAERKAEAEKWSAELLSIAKRQADAELQIMEKAEKDAIFFGKQLEEQAEEEIRVMSETAHWTAFYRNLQLTTEKNVYDERIKAMAEFADQEEERALEQGAILAAGDSHTVKLEALRASLLTAEELENKAHEKKLKLLAEFSEEELAAMGGGQAIIEEMEQGHQQRLFGIRSRGLTTLADFNRASWMQQSKTVFGELANVTAGVAQHNKTLFQINKVAGIAMAIINMHEGISRSLAVYPWPIAGIMAAIHGAAGLAQIAAIRATSFGGGGGGSAPSIAGSTPAQPSTDVQSGAVAPQQTTTVKILRVEGLNDQAIFSGKQLRSILEQLAESSTDGGRVVVA